MTENKKQNKNGGIQFLFKLVRLSISVFTDVHSRWAIGRIDLKGHYSISESLIFFRGEDQ